MSGGGQGVLSSGGGATAVDRRTVLKLTGAAALLPVAACAPPPEEIVPYAGMPEGAVPGRPRFYATALALTDYAMPAVVEAHQGRPTKVEGNARHPASGGASDATLKKGVSRGERRRALRQRRAS